MVGKMVTDETKVYIVKGAGNRGKTTLIFHLAQYLYNDGAVVVKKLNKKGINFNDSVCDYGLILNYNGKNILIMSKGDDDKQLRKQWEKIYNFSDRIDIIIGACRTRGRTVWWWKNKFEKINFFDNNSKMKNEFQRKSYVEYQLKKLKKMIFS